MKQNNDSRETYVKESRKIHYSTGWKIWDFIGIWGLEFEISEYPNTRDSISIDDLSIGYSTVTLHVSRVFLLFYP